MNLAGDLRSAHHHTSPSHINITLTVDPHPGLRSPSAFALIICSQSETLYKPWTSPRISPGIEERIMKIRQAERPLEQYVEEFLSVCHLLFCSITPVDRCKPVTEFINHVLALSHSNFYGDVEDSILPPIREHAAAPAHHQPASSTRCSNEPAVSGLPSLPPDLHSSSLIVSPELAASTHTPAAVGTQTPATVTASSWMPAAASTRTPAAVAASTRTPPAVSTRTPPPASPPRSRPIMMASVLDPPLVSVRAADMRVAAASSASGQVTAAFPEASQVAGASPESSQAAADMQESSQAAAAFTEPSQVAAVFPEPSQAAAAFTEPELPPACPPEAGLSPARCILLWRELRLMGGGGG
ncbi:hypothetical protein M9458_056934 [Cirrhinus mrigala]|uniref:Retrotransposon gag domain-containing protein n=1 Tax=Cirrhinus mrigala TaxID=683832 RepID=A0ABD0MC24_CIRMR